MILVKSVPRGPGGLGDELQTQRAHVRAQTPPGTEAWQVCRREVRRMLYMLYIREEDWLHVGLWGGPQQRVVGKIHRPTQRVCVRCLLGLM